MPDFFSYLTRNENDITKDLILIANDGIKYKVHKNVVLKKWKNPGNVLPANYNLSLGKLPQLQTSIRSTILNLIIDYCYDINIAIFDQSFTIIEQLLDCADSLNLIGLVEQLLDNLVARITPDNCLTFWKLCKRFRSKHSFKVHDFVLYNLIQYINFSLDLLYDWYRLSVDEVVFILRDDYLNVRDEEDVWYLACVWMGVNRPSRMQYALRFSQLLRMQNRFELLTLASNESFGLLPKDFTSKMAIRQLECRFPRDLIAIFGGSNREVRLSNNLIVELYDKRTKEWGKSSSIPGVCNTSNELVTIGQQIYMIGGRGGRSSVSMLSPPDSSANMTMNWEERAPMHCSRSFPTSCVLNEKIYVFGGSTSEEGIGTAERYDSTTNQWTKLPDMTTTRSNAAAVALNGRIYVIGGYDDRNVLSTVEAFDEEAGMWMEVRRMKSARKAHAAVAWNGGILVVGGLTPCSIPELSDELVATNSVEFYNPTRNTWTELKVLDCARYHFALLVFQDEVFAIGGQVDGENSTNIVERFDGTNWLIDSFMCTSRSHHKACVLRNWPATESLIHYSTTSIGGSRPLTKAHNIASVPKRSETVNWEESDTIDKYLSTSAANDK